MFWLNKLIIGSIVLTLTVYANPPSDDEINDLINSIFTSVTPNGNVPHNNNQHTAPGPTNPPSHTTGLSIVPSTEASDPNISKDQNVCEKKSLIKVRFIGILFFFLLLLL